ncbi:hypothetical protein BN2476_210156 [Paraburkholderia piptadeniae]|uniref:Uncharacterized protein n=1 Tax=Paraburkholderia piptadeniae TaxID=1701573 RepID=A0A1N7RXA1_9BURK|nr:hypothetical protein BN2476_210156 [Paraburkholderia piptadeniae]
MHMRLMYVGKPSPRNTIRQTIFSRSGRRVGISSKHVHMRLILCERVGTRNTNELTMGENYDCIMAAPTPPRSVALLLNSLSTRSSRRRWSRRPSMLRPPAHGTTL